MTKETFAVLSFVLIVLLLTVQPVHAGAFALVRSAPVTTAGTAGLSGSIPIIQVAQPYTFSQAAGNVSVTAANQFTLGGGVGSPASAIAQAALAVGTGAAGFTVSPAIAIALAAATVGMVGYEMYKALKDKGVTFNPDGSVSASPVIMSCMSSNWLGSWCYAAALGMTPDGIYTTADCPYGGSPNTRDTPYAETAYSTMYNSHFGVTVYGICVAATKPTPPPSPASNDFMVQAIDAATAASPKAAADAANFALARGVNPMNYVPASTPNNAPNPYTVTLPDGTIVTITPPATAGASDAVDPPPSTSTAAPAPYPFTNPYTSQTAPNTPPAATQPTLCETNPNASACADLGTAPAAEVIPTSTIDISQQLNFSAFNFAGSSLCPAPKSYHLASGGGSDHVFTWQPACTFMDAFRPVALAIAYFIAGLIVLGQRSADTGG